MAKIELDKELAKLSAVRNEFDDRLLKGSIYSSEERRNFVNYLCNEFKNIFTPNTVRGLEYIVSSYDFNTKIIEFLKEENFCKRLKFISEWNEEKFNNCKKIKDYFTKVGVGTEQLYSYGFSSAYSIFVSYFTENEKYSDEKVIDAEIYDAVMNSDVVIRFLNAFSKEAKYIPGEFVQIKLGIMPQRIIDKMPEQSKVYVYKHFKKDLSSPGIILDIVDDKKIRVKDKGRWYKVSIATPFSIFCVEERHIKKYAPTKEYVVDLYNRFTAENNK